MRIVEGMDIRPLILAWDAHGALGKLVLRVGYEGCAVEETLEEGWDREERRR